jgi:parvulin-like peptidyl-prolyl isomerase
MSRLRALIALAALALVACDGGDPVILKLAGERVRRSDFERHLSAIEARGLGPLSAEVRRGVLDAFLEQRALVIEARRRGLLPANALTEDELPAVTRLLAAAAPAAAVTDAEISAWHAVHEGELRLPETVSLRQVLVGSLNEARDVRRRLAKSRDPSLFDQIARAQSKGPEAAVGGYMGWFSPGQLPPELERAAFGLPVAAVSEPVESPLGYHVIRVESRQAAREIPLEEARERIRDRLAREKRAAAERAFVADVMARARVNHEAALRPSSRPS